MSRTQMIIIFTFKFFMLMISLDHSFVHALNKQKKYLMCECKDT